ncbi:MAG TPA: hypothetical protein ENO23_11175 [Alphaproteobacteria bacterium]|nr:hypothetical protein [Alphaproteobacteria bacterium]
MEETLGFRLFVLEVTGNLAGARKVAREEGLDVPVLLDCASWARGTLHIAGTPTTIVVGRDGRVRARLLGGADDLPAIVRNVIEEIGGKTTAGE